MGHVRRLIALIYMQTELFDIDENDFVPYPQAFVPVANQSLPLSLTQHFNLPPDLSGLSEPSQLYETSFFPQPLEEPEEVPPFACSVCGASGGTLALAVLDPCAHPLCPQCLTSALNIVGEKDMECAVCKSKVDNFQLHKSPPASGFKAGPTTTEAAKKRASIGSTREMNVLQGLYDTTPARSNGGLPEYDDFAMDRAQGSSTPVSARRGAEESVVLRIDNVPWVGPFLIWARTSTYV